MFHSVDQKHLRRITRIARRNDRSSEFSLRDQPILVLFMSSLFIRVDSFDSLHCF